MSRLQLCLVLLLCLALPVALGACSSSDSPDQIIDPGPDPDPDPEFDYDVVRFRVWTLESGGVEQLRWIGTHEGPLEDSPEQTRWPWIGFGRAFRVDWRAFSGDEPVATTKYLVSQSDTGAWLEAEGDGLDFQFANAIPAADLVGQDCPEGEDCVASLRFESGRHRLEVVATTEAGRELDAELGLLEFEVNYPPLLEVVVDPATGPTDPDASPVASWRLDDGSLHSVALAPGDTVPSGATVRMRLRAHDRVFSAVQTDSFCCDELLDAGGASLRYQGHARFAWEDRDGDHESFFTMFGESMADSVFWMNAGPFDYELGFRAKDEHDRPGDTVYFRFVAGLPPQPPAPVFPEGARALLNPDRAAGPGEIGFSVTGPETRGWDRSAKDWFDDLDLSVQMTGHWYEIPLRFRGAPHPRVAGVSPFPPPEASDLSAAYSDHVRAFAYELVHEDDPQNYVYDGPSDRDDFFLKVDRIGELDLTGDRAWRLFIPDLFFTLPEYFDPAGDCPEPVFCEMGAWMEDRLGEFELRLRSRTTHYGSWFEQESPQAARSRVMDLRNHGRFSDWVSQTVSVHVALTDEGGAIIGIWPTASP